MTKLRARLLTKLCRYADAADIYRLIMQRSDMIIWAKLGFIQNLFLDEHIEESETLLIDLTHSELTSDKACEWLARISVNNNQYNKAETQSHSPNRTHSLVVMHAGRSTPDYTILPTL